MKIDYDVMGCGEGLSGLLSCVILAGKGMKCLWVDTAPEKPQSGIWNHMPFIMTQAFYRGILEPVLYKFDKCLLETMGAEQGLSLQYLGASEHCPCGYHEKDRDHSKALKMNDAYVSLLKKSLKKPRHYLKELRTGNPSDSEWARCIGPALSTYEACRMAHMRALVSVLGMSSMEQGNVKERLISFLQRHQGIYRQDPQPRFVMDDGALLCMESTSGVEAGHVCIAEDPPGQRPFHGFYFLGGSRARLGQLPRGIEDIILIPPPSDLKYPIMVKIGRDPENPRISIQTRIPVEPGLTSCTEIISWASGMIVKKLSRDLPFLSMPLQSLEVVNPLSNDTIRPWFRFSEDVRPPSLFGWKRYITPQERIFACDRDKYACLGGEGDFFWGICIANAILKEFGRSDLVSV